MTTPHFVESQYADHLRLKNTTNATKLPEETTEEYGKRRTLLYRRHSYFKKCALAEIEIAKQPKVANPPIVRRSHVCTVDNDVQNTLAMVGKKYFKLKNIEKWSQIFLKGRFIRLVVVTELVHREAPQYLSEKGARGNIFDLTKALPEEKAELVRECNRPFLVQVYEAGKTKLWSDLFLIPLSNVGNCPGLRNKAGYGLFAARPLKASETIGWYIGHTRKVDSFSNKKDRIGATEYIIRVEAQDGTKYLVDAGRQPQPRLDKRKPVYFGIHFANDPNWGKTMDERNQKDPPYNAQIDRHLEVIALNDIAMGEEILLDYEGDACNV
jgi:hypothetical protein